MVQLRCRIAQDHHRNQRSACRAAQLQYNHPRRNYAVPSRASTVCESGGISLYRKVRKISEPGEGRIYMVLVGGCGGCQYSGSRSVFRFAECNDIYGVVAVRLRCDTGAHDYIYLIMMGKKQTQRRCDSAKFECTCWDWNLMIVF